MIFVYKSFVQIQMLKLRRLRDQQLQVAVNENLFTGRLPGFVNDYFSKMV